MLLVLLRMVMELMSLFMKAMSFALSISRRSLSDTRLSLRISAFQVRTVLSIQYLGAVVLERLPQKYLAFPIVVSSLGMRFVP